MNLAFESVKDIISRELPEILFTTEENTSMSAPITISSIAITSTGIDPIYGEYVEFLISDNRGRLLDNYNLTYYEGNINSVNTVKVISHVLVGNDDYIKCINVASFIKDGTVPIEDITFDLKNEVYCEWEYIPVSTSLGIRAHSYAEGIKIDFMVKTKEDENKSRIDSYVDKIRNKFMSSLMTLPIMSKDTIPIRIGTFKTLDKPHVRKNYREGSNIQMRTISVIGSYMINYKK